MYNRVLNDRPSCTVITQIFLDRVSLNLVCSFPMDQRFHRENFRKVIKAKGQKVARSKAKILKR